MQEITQLLVKSSIDPDPHPLSSIVIVAFLKSGANNNNNNLSAWISHSSTSRTGLRPQPRVGQEEEGKRILLIDLDLAGNTRPWTTLCDWKTRTLAGSRSKTTATMTEGRGTTCPLNNINNNIIIIITATATVTLEIVLPIAACRPQQCQDQAGGETTATTWRA